MLAERGSPAAIPEDGAALRLLECDANCNALQVRKATYCPLRAGMAPNLASTPVSCITTDEMHMHRRQERRRSASSASA